MIRFLSARLARARQPNLSRVEIFLLAFAPWALWFFPSWRSGWTL